MTGLKLNEATLSGATDPRPAANSPHKQAEIQDAAEKFEALLLSQILRSARESGEEKGDSATEFAEQHLASALAHNGGLGLAAMISKGLSKTPGV